MNISALLSFPIVWWRKPCEGLDGHGVFLCRVRSPERTVWETVPTKRVFEITNWDTRISFITDLEMLTMMMDRLDIWLEF